jgi:hypothetical protein
MKNKTILIGGIFLTLLSYGCRDLGSVRKLSQNWEVVDQTAKIIGDDFYQSCLRSAKYPKEKKFPDVIYERKESGEKCRENYLSVSQDVTNANLVLSKYLNQLFILADEKTGSPENDLKSLGESVNNLVGALQTAFGTTVTLPNKEDINTGINILEYIFNFFANKFRYEELGSAIVCGDIPIQSYSNGLIALIEDTYSNGVLKEEENDLDGYLTNLAPVDLINPKEGVNLPLYPAQRIALPSERLAEQQLVSFANEQYDAIEQRRKVARSYVALIKKIKTDHQNLAGEFQKELKINDSDKEEFCNDYLQAIKDKREKEGVEISKKRTVEILLSIEKSAQEYDKIISNLKRNTWQN